MSPTQRQGSPGNGGGTGPPGSGGTGPPGNGGGTGSPGNGSCAGSPGDRATPYELAQRRGQEALRRALLDGASGLLVAEGPGALTMRRMAAVAGCSTTVLYTMFGAKEGLADALYREGFERLRTRLEAVPGSDPLGRLAALADAYRVNALAQRAYYGVMFQQAIPGFRPSPASLAVAAASLQVLALAVRDAMAAGALAPGDPLAVAEVLWAAVHGAVSLELAGHFPDPEVAADRFRTLASAAILPFLPDAPTPRRR
jgi:AcrR family transcriptional regulator